jgi:DAPG hydrolase PhiG domain
LEKITREWIGYGVKDGKVVRDKTTPASMLCEEYLRKVLVHATTEAQQLGKFLPELYARYKDLPDDAD